MLRRTLVMAATALMIASPAAIAAEAPTASSVKAPVARPVYQVNFADPGIVRDGRFYVGYATSARVKSARSPSAFGPWRALGEALPSLGPWASVRKGVWAPDVERTSAGWVMYYSAVHLSAKNDQRCIGVAVSKRGAQGPFTPLRNPLICPYDPRAADRVPGRPVAGAGVIDPAPFRAADGRRYVIYKTQQKPSSIRMFPVSADGRSGIGRPSRQLVRRPDTTEAPVMVQRNGRFFLFVSRFNYADCSYATRWLRSADRWKWTGRETTLLTTAGTGLCGPGGADLVPGPGGSTRIFFHAWDRATGTQRKRQMYAGVLTWGRDGRTPTVSRFLSPASAVRAP